MSICKSTFLEFGLFDCYTANHGVLQFLFVTKFRTENDTPEQFAALIKAEMPRWGKVVKDAKIEPE